MTTITAQTILRSRHSQSPDKVLSTLLLRYPRWIHAELMTHRVFSRNAASSRAIPVAKMIQDVLDNPAVPLLWGKNQKGMQAGEEIDTPIDHIDYEFKDDQLIATRRLISPQAAWLVARDRAVLMARKFAEAGYHKQIVNRLLEPFSHITVLVSATEWSNFLALRDHPDAEPHIAILAREIRRELEREDNIQVLEPGEWHMPFVAHEPGARGGAQALIKKSVACCASTSYKTVDGFEMTLEKAIELHDKLVGATPLHASPAEHVALADEEYSDWCFPEQHGNFQGFRQYRKMLPGECQ